MNTRVELTCDYSSEEADGLWGRVAGGPQGLQDVLGEREGGNGVAGGHDDQQRHPEVEEGG